MYTLNIEDSKLFNENNYYKVKCVGKCTKGNDPSFFRAIYFITCHTQKYIAYERLNGFDDIKVDVTPVEVFTVPDDYDQYMLFTGVVDSPVKERIANKLGSTVMKFRGFYIFRQLYYTEAGCAMGGIDDSFSYRNVSRREFNKSVKETEANL